MNPTKIEWAQSVWNPITGCSYKSEGCDHCYAERMAKRLKGRNGYPSENPFDVTFHPDKLDQPSLLKSPKRIFVCSMGDLFHEDVEPIMISLVLHTIRKNPQHTFMILTKRPEVALEHFSNNVMFMDQPEPGKFTLRPLPPNVWFGVTAENQARADERIPILLDIPGAKRFVSIEPMLGPVDISRWLRITWQCSGCRGYFNGPYQRICPDCGREEWWSGSHKFNGRNMPHHPIWPPQSGQGIDWVICGGESGPGARPMHPDWVRSLRDQCQAAETPFFFKQWGEWWPGYGASMESLRQLPRHIHKDAVCMFRGGKKLTGRLLDGHEWNDFPATG